VSVMDTMCTPSLVWSRTVISNEIDWRHAGCNAM
jgi:hypothetical protein